MGVTVETGVILVSYINKMRREGIDIATATREAAPPAFTTHHDDGPFGMSRTFAGSAFHRHGIRHPETVGDLSLLLG
jgi:hypothetical protein